MIKRFFITLSIFIVTILLWISLGVNPVHRNTYVPSAILDITSPMNVTIDIDFLKSLNPAYEQQ